MTVEVEYTEREFIQAYTIPGRKARLRNSIAAVIFGLLLGARAIFAPEPFFVFLAGVGAVVLVSGLLIPWNFSASLKRLWKTHPVYSEPKRYTIDASGFASDSYSGTSILRWHAFSHWTETSQLFLVFFGPQVSYCVPKRCLESLDQINELRDILKREIGRTKYAPPVRAFPVSGVHAGPSADGSPAQPR
jgi:hypothetical protein